MTLKELLEKRQSLAAEIKRLAEKQDDWTAEDETNWVQINADYDANLKALERAERADAVLRIPEPTESERRTMGRTAGDDGRKPARGQGGPTDEHRSRAVGAWCRTQMGRPLDERDEEACELLDFNPRQPELRFNMATSRELAAMQEQANGVHPSLMRRTLASAGIDTGGAVIPEEFVRNLEIAMLAWGGMLQVAEIIRTDGGGDLPWPSANDTANTGRRIAESGAVTTTTDPTFKQTVLHAYKYTSDAILVPYELLEDSAFDLSSVIAGMLGERLGRILNTECTTGTGNAQPNGIITAATLGKTTSSATAIEADEVIDLVHSVDPAYRNGARFMMHDSVLAYVRKLKDSYGAYIWQPGLQLGIPDALYSYPITINQDMASAVTTTLKTMLFGQLRAYKIREVRGIRFYRLVERYRDNDQDGFVAFVRRDGNLIDAGTHPVKYMQQA